MADQIDLGQLIASADDFTNGHTVSIGGLGHELYSESGYNYAVNNDEIAYIQAEGTETMRVGDEVSFSSVDNIINTALLSSKRYLTSTEFAADQANNGDMASLQASVVKLGLEGAKNDMVQAVIKKDLEQRSKSIQQLNK
jgi:hypothetical protein